MATSIIDYIFRELAITYLGRDDLAQVTPDDLRPDALGTKSPEPEFEEEEIVPDGHIPARVGGADPRGLTPVGVAKALAAKALTAKSAASGGSTNGGNGGSTTTNRIAAHVVGASGSTNGGGAKPQAKATLTPKAASQVEHGFAAATAVRETAAAAQAHNRAEQIRLARMMGYEGDACLECGQFTLVRNGTCLKCTTCGSTTGCS